MAVKRYRGDKALADKLFSEIIRSVGTCEADGYAGRACSRQLHTAHIISRGRSVTRTDTRGAYCLCASHHRFFHDFPREFSRFISRTWAQEYYDALYQKSLTPLKGGKLSQEIFWKERVEFLKRIKNGEITLEQARKLEDD